MERKEGLKIFRDNLNENVLIKNWSYLFESPKGLVLKNRPKSHDKDNLFDSYLKDFYWA